MHEPRVVQARALALAGAATLLLLGGAAPRARAQAAPDSLVRTSRADLPEELRLIADVRFRGLKALGKRQLKAANLRTRKPSILPWRERPTLRRDYLLSDSASIVSLYRHYGHLDAAVHVLLEPTHDPHAARVVFVVREGPLSRIASVELRGVTAYPQKDVRRVLFAQVGRPFDPAFTQLDTSRIFALYQERGYFAHTSADARRDSSDTTRVRIVYSIAEGLPYLIGKVDYTATGDVRESLARRELLLKPGATYRRSRLDDSIERLYKTTLYKQVQVTPLPDSSRQVIDFLMYVSERKPRWVDAGIGSGSGTTDRLHAEADWGHRNLDTRALQGLFDVRYALDGSANFSDARGDFTLTEPWLLGVRVQGQSGLFYEQSDDRTNSAYVLHSKVSGVNFQLYYELGRTGRVTLLETNAFVHQSFTPLDTTLAIIQAVRDTVIPSYHSNTLRLTLERDHRDDKVLPTSGTYQQLSGELAGGPLKGQSSYTKGILTGIWYRPLNNGWNLAVRGSAGLMAPFGTASSIFAPDLGVDPQVARVPLTSRFTIGGVNSVRGYAEGSVPQGGGLVMGLANVEMRIPLVGPFGIETFMDAGNVWARPAYIRSTDFISPFQSRLNSPDDIYYTYGVGGRLVLPFGPLRVDFSWSRRPHFPHLKHYPFAIQFAIGPSF